MPTEPEEEYLVVVNPEETKKKKGKPKCCFGDAMKAR
jgi:hypothetical protein